MKPIVVAARRERKELSGAAVASRVRQRQARTQNTAVAKKTLSRKYSGSARLISVQTSCGSTPRSAHHSATILMLIPRTAFQWKNDRLRRGPGVGSLN